MPTNIFKNPAEISVWRHFKKRNVYIFGVYLL